MDPVRYSNLRNLSKSPAHYLSSITIPRKDSPAMALGRATHSIVLEGGAGLLVYEGERRGKAWAEFKDTHPEQEIVTAAEYDRAKAIADAVLADPVAAPLLRGSEVLNEQRVTWEMDGLPCALRFDALGPTWLADLKTTGDAAPRAFQRHAERYLYHAQCAWYRSALVGAQPLDCYLVAVETDAPYAVTVLRLSEDLLELGNRTWRGWWQTLLKCTATNVWPGYAAGPVEWETNPWQEDPMAELDFTTTEAPPSAAARYLALKAEMAQLGDALRAERLGLLEKLRNVDSVLAEVPAPVAAKKVVVRRRRIALNGAAEVIADAV